MAKRKSVQDKTMRGSAAKSARIGKTAETEEPDLGPSDAGSGPALESRQSTATLDEGEKKSVGGRSNVPDAQIALVGYVELATATIISGWAWFPSAPDRHVTLSLVQNDKEISTTVCDEPGDGLLRSGDCEGNYSFHFDIAADDLDPGIHTYKVLERFSGVELEGSPIYFDVPELEAKAPFQGDIDYINDNEISGWIYRPSDLSKHFIVLLRRNGRVIAQARADLFRKDILDAGAGQGDYGFNIQMPQALLDGSEHFLEVVEEESQQLVGSSGGIRWSAGAGARRSIGIERHADLPNIAPSLSTYAEEGISSVGKKISRAAALRSAGFPSDQGSPSIRSLKYEPPSVAKGSEDRTFLLFDLSDLVYYIGHHRHLTGIQRVQSSIVLSLLNRDIAPNVSMAFLSYNASRRRWVAIPVGFLKQLLEDLFLPESRRVIKFSMQDARFGLLPGAVEYDGSNDLSLTHPSVLCLLGAAWVQQDYFHRVLTFKRRFGTRFAMLLHDLIPIVAKETCDQGTVEVFEEFLSRAVRHVDHFFCVSENTAKDLRKYFDEKGIPRPVTTVTKLGSSFEEFLRTTVRPDTSDLWEIPERYVLFVSTIEGRKNHQFIFNVWKRMVAEGRDPPTLVCVGRAGWKAQGFLTDLIESSFLNRRIILLQDIDDEYLKELYHRCLFTVFPSLYEGWGLPVAESLAAGKVCVCSDRASLSEVAGSFGFYVDIDNIIDSTERIAQLIEDNKLRHGLENSIGKGYIPVSWASVADTIMYSCQEAARMEWSDPYPYNKIPYSTEISFAHIRRSNDGLFGDDLLQRTVASRKPSLLLETLGEENFRSGEEIRGLGVWGEPESWGTWLCYNGGEVTFVVENNDSQYYYLFLRLRATGPTANEKIKLIVNGELLWSDSVGERSKTILLRVHKRRSGDYGWKLRLRAELTLTEDLVGRIATMDARVPTLGFERFAIIPENDMKARLDATYTYMMG